MTRRYCHSCAAPLPRAERRPAAVCQRCALSGPNTPSDRRRWTIRTSTGGTRGPLSLDALTDQVLRGALGPADLAARRGGRWIPIIEHPDLQSFFLPGNQDAERLVTSQEDRKRDRRAGDARRLFRLVGSIVLAVGAVGTSVYAVQNGLFVLPEELVEEVSGFFDQTGDAVSDQVARAVDADAAAEDFERRRVLPGGEVLEALQAKWPNAGGAAHLRLQRGRVGLWSGTDAELKRSREHLEQAVVLSPSDPEAWASLAELYSLLLPDDPSLSDHLVLAVDRVLSMNPEDVSAARAAAMSAYAHGNRGKAADIANRCASKPGSAGQEGSTTDLGCAIVAAQAQGLVADLETLFKRYDGTMRVALPYAQVLVEKEQYRRAIEVAEALRARYPKEVGPLEVLLNAHVALGEWEDARRAGQRIVELNPSRMQARVTVAEIQLKVFGAARPAFKAFQEAIAHPRFASFPKRGRALTDAAAAAILAGKHQSAIEYADAALAIAERDSVAGLQKARALQALGKTTEAEALLRATEPTLLHGHDLARWHVAAAAFYIDAGRERLAESELRSAAETDPFWPRIPLETARNRLKVGDRDGAIQFLEKAAFMDLYVDSVRDPLQRVWADDTDWKQFRRDLENELLGDARYTSRGYGGMGVVAVYGGMSDARRILERALAGGANGPAANATLAQLHMAEGRSALAIKHASQVVETSGNPGVLYGIRGRAMARKGDAAQSRAAFVQALEKSPNEASLYRWRAEAQLEGDDRRGARKSLGEALRLMPDDIVSRMLLIDLKGGVR